MKVAVITFPGSNCDRELAEAVRIAGGDARLVWHRDGSLSGFDAVMLPGGFSYGDYLRAGAIACLSPILARVRDFAVGGGPVLGICNGFQLLCEAGLLPGALTRNVSLRFQSETVHVRVERPDTPFTAAYSAGDVLRMPMAHAEGRYYADVPTLKRIEKAGLVAFRYANSKGVVGGRANPNGSAADVAGLANAHGNVLGMMPHPERAVEAITGSLDGLGVFESLLAGAEPTVSNAAGPRDEAGRRRSLSTAGS